MNEENIHISDDDLLAELDIDRSIGFTVAFSRAMEKKKQKIEKERKDKEGKLNLQESQ